jgi:hypothetical protein
VNTIISALSTFDFRVAKGWLGLSPRSPGVGIEESAIITQPEKSNLTEHYSYEGSGDSSVPQRITRPGTLGTCQH